MAISIWKPLLLLALPFLSSVEAFDVDGTVTVNGGATASFNLNAYGVMGNFDTTSQTEVFTTDIVIPDGVAMTCFMASCTTGGSGNSINVRIKYGSQFSSTTDGTGSGDQTSCSSSTTTVTATNSMGSSQTGYVMAVDVNANGGIASATIECTATIPVTPAPTTAPTTGSGSGSTSTPSPTAAPTCACFSDASTVEVQGKGEVALEDVRIGDHVFVGSHQKGKNRFQEVYAFGHHNKATHHEYLAIHTAGSTKPLELSASHLIYVNGKHDPVRADTVRVGDQVRMDTMDAPSFLATVTKVKKVSRRGAFMPLVKDGSLVVNNVHASSYVSIMDDAPAVVSRFHSFLSDKDLLHWWLAPYRMFCLGISSKLCDGSYNDEGIASWLVLGRSIAMAGNKMWWGSQFLGLVFITLFMAMFVLLEKMVDHAFSVLGICLLILLRRRLGAKRPSKAKLE